MIYKTITEIKDMLILLNKLVDKIRIILLIIILKTINNIIQNKKFPKINFNSSNY